MKSMKFLLDVQMGNNGNYLLSEHDLRDILLNHRKNEKSFSTEVKNRLPAFNKWTKDNIVDNVNEIDSISCRTCCLEIMEGVLLSVLAFMRSCDFSYRFIDPFYMISLEEKIVFLSESIVFFEEKYNAALELGDEELIDEYKRKLSHRRYDYERTILEFNALDNNGNGLWQV